MIDFRAPLWTVLLKKKRVAEIMEWFASITKLMAGQGRRATRSKDAAESVIGLLALCVLFVPYFAFLYLLILAPTSSQSALLTYLLLGITSFACFEIIATVIFENVFLKHRLRLRFLRGEFDVDRWGHVIGDMTASGNWSINFRTTWKWFLVLAVALLGAVHFWTAPGLTALQAPAVLPVVLFCALRRVPRIAPTLRQPFADIVAYSNDSAEIADVHRYFAQFMSLLLESNTESGEPFYDEIHIVAHSMGNLVVFESLYNIWKLCWQRDQHGPAFSRIRSFTSLGSGFEKMYAHVRSEDLLSDDDGAIQRVSVALQFLRPPALGGASIAWRNIYYLWDPVADAVGLRSHCENINLSTPFAPTPFVDPHSAYIHDPKVARILATVFGFETKPLCFRMRPLDWLQLICSKLFNANPPTHRLRQGVALVVFLTWIASMRSLTHSVSSLTMIGMLGLLLAFFLVLIGFDEQADPVAE